MRVFIFLLIAIGMFSGIVSAQPMEALPGNPLTNGRVYSLSHGNGKIFLSGDFSWFGDEFGSAYAVFDKNLTLNSGYPKINDGVQFAISDDAGGWYALGYQVLYHIKSDKTVDTVPLTADAGFIYEMVKSGNLLYLCGTFTSLNGTPKKYIAAFDLTTNTLTSWDANATGYVYAIAVYGSTVYAGGNFTSIGGQSRSKVAALDASTGLATAWNPSVIAGSGYVHVIIPTATAVYFGGSFTNVGGGVPARTNFAAVDVSTGALLSFNPHPNGTVDALELDGNTLYIAGRFTQLNGMAKPAIGALDITSGNLTGFDVKVDNGSSSGIFSLAVIGQKLYIGGVFLTINNVEQSRLAMVDKTTGTLSTTPVQVSDGVQVLSVSGSNLLVGGYLQGLYGTARTKGFVALDEATGAVDAWNPASPMVPPDGYYSDLVVKYYDDVVYYRERANDGTYFLGALTATDGSAFSGFSATVDDYIDAWAFTDNAIYIAGAFTQVNGSPRGGFAALNLNTGALLPWTITYQPAYPGESINSMLVYNDVLYVAGYFSFTDGVESRTDLAAWDATTGDLLPWDPVISYNNPIVGTVDGPYLYLIGNGVARVNLDTGDPDTGWKPFTTTDRVRAVAVQGNSVFLGGEFSPGLERVDITTGAVDSWQPSIEDVTTYEQSVLALEASSTRLYVGGSFDYMVAGVARSSYAVYLWNTATVPMLEDTNVAVCDKDSAMLIVDASGVDIKYQWQKLNDSSGQFDNLEEGTPYTGVDAATLTIAPGDASVPGQYRCVVSTIGGDLASDTATLNIDNSLCNQAPVIAVAPIKTSIGSSLVVDLSPFLSDPDDNLDLNTLTIVVPPVSGATASIEGTNLLLDYSGTSFSGTDSLSIGICDTDGICTQQKLIVEVTGDLFVFNGISPNGDLINSVFLLKNIDLLPDTRENHVTIYDRWGDVIFEVDNYDNEDRSFRGFNKNGKKVPSGTYFYKVDFKSGRKPLTGYLAVKH